MVWLANRRNARRYPIVTSLLFREHGSSAWHPAATINLSRVGVLFRPEGPPPDRGRFVDFVFALPLNGVTPPPQARCAGHVVRIGRDEFAGGGRVVAVTIDDYALERQAPA